jgi:hypothetical protein
MIVGAQHAVPVRVALRRVLVGAQHAVPVLVPLVPLFGSSAIRLVLGSWFLVLGQNCQTPQRNRLYVGHSDS